MRIQKPNNLSRLKTKVSVEDFQRFIKEVNEWIKWFDLFFDIFEYVIKWLGERGVENAIDLSQTMHNIRTSPTITLKEHREVAAKGLKILEPLENNIARLYDLLNQSESFQIIVSGTLDDKSNAKKYIQELKRLQPNNTFTVEKHKTFTKTIPLNSRQHVYWSIASDCHECNLHISHKKKSSCNQEEILFEGENVHVEKHVLSGEFEIQHDGDLNIQVRNSGQAPRTIWFRIKQISLLPKFNLFNGIFKFFYEKQRNEAQAMSEELVNELLAMHVFPLIDNLLKGNISLQEMDELKDVFRGNNISFQDELMKLYTNQRIGASLTKRERHGAADADTDIKQKIERVCEMLQSYQYYSCIIVRDNIQIINLWLSVEETSVFDNALITMEHLYKCGMVHIHLRHLLNEPANLEIDYLISKNQGMVTHRPDNRKYEKQESYSSDSESDKNSDYDDARQEDAHNNEDNSDEESDNDENEAQLDKDNLKFTLSKADIDDHKRQLTFCKVDLDEDMIDKRNLLDEQLTLLKRIDEIFSLLTKLVMDGHPAYQLMDKHIKINYRASECDETC
ncbi:unnamed protein product [Rotaria sp. Silwood2]|nr:unnamed protein product [Rotaria sp. Silwood2]